MRDVGVHEPRKGQQNMKFLVTDRSGIEDGVLVKSSYIVISIHDTNSRAPRVKQQSGLRGVLQLAFDDPSRPTTRVSSTLCD